MPVLIIGFMIGIVFFSIGDIGEVLRQIGQIDLVTLSTVLALSLLNYAIRFGRWTMMLRDPAAPVPVARHFMIYMAGFALTTTPGKVGETIRTVYLRPFGVGYRRCLAALYAERVFDVIVISVLAMLILQSSGIVARSLGLVGAGVAAVLIAAQHPAAVGLLERLARAWPGRRIGSLIDLAAGFLRDVRSMMTGRLAVAGIVLGLAAWGAEGLGTWLVAQALGIDIGLGLAVGIYATAMLAGALSFLPGGLGSTEAVMISLLVYAGATPPTAIAVTAIVRLATLWFAVALGMGAWLGIEAVRGAVPAGLGLVSRRERSHARSRSGPDGP